MPRYILLLLQTVSLLLSVVKLGLRARYRSLARQGSTRCRRQPMLGRPKQNYIALRPTLTNHTPL